MRTVCLGINVSEEDGTDYQSDGFNIQVPDEMSTSEILQKFVKRIENVAHGKGEVSYLLAPKIPDD